MDTSKSQCIFCYLCDLFNIQIDLLRRVIIDSSNSHYILLFLFYLRIRNSPHHLMTTCPHAHMSTSPHVHVTTYPHHHITTSPHVHVTTCPYHHISTSQHATSPHAHMSTSPHVHITTSPHVHHQTRTKRLASQTRTSSQICVTGSTLNKTM